MNIQLVSTIITAGSELISEIIRNLAPAISEPASFQELSIPEPESPKKIRRYVEEEVEKFPIAPVAINIVPQQVVQSPTQPTKPESGTAIPTGCIPCSLGHVGTCSGLMNEAVRFSKGEKGAKADEVIDRVNMCLDELNSLERKDLRPEKVMQLNGWERDLAEQTLKTSRSLRHKLEDVSNITPEGLTQIAGETQSMRQEIGRKWFQNKIATLSQEDQENIKSRIMARLGEIKQNAAEGELPDLSESSDEEE